MGFIITSSGCCHDYGNVESRPWMLCRAPLPLSVFTNFACCLRESTKHSRNRQAASLQEQPSHRKPAMLTPTGWQCPYKWPLTPQRQLSQMPFIWHLTHSYAFLSFAFSNKGGEGGIRPSKCKKSWQINFVFSKPTCQPISNRSQLY